MRYLIAWLLALTMVSFDVHSTAAQTCVVGSWDTLDMTGRYLSQSNQILLEIGLCRALVVTWDSGRHQAVYVAQDKLPSGGYLAAGRYAQPLGVFLDDHPVIGVEPAEPGWIKLTTVSSDGNGRRAYRLQKTR